LLPLVLYIVVHHTMFKYIL